MLLRAREQLADEAGFAPVLAELRKSRRSAEAVAQSIEYAALEAWIDETVRRDSD
ncbi:hypothetical protein GS924_24970 [Rhodococcus hoagii]|nr:hypothetical protein [Prescottella equi]